MTDKLVVINVLTMPTARELYGLQVTRTTYGELMSWFLTGKERAHRVDGLNPYGDRVTVLLAREHTAAIVRGQDS